MILTAKQIIGLPVYTKMGQSLGKVISFEVDTNTHLVSAYLVKSHSLMARFFQESLLIHTEQVITLKKDRMIVQDTLIPSEEPTKATLQSLEGKSMTAKEVAPYSLVEKSDETT